MKEPRAKDVLRAIEVRPTKVRGQNFLIDQEVLAAIIEFGAPKAGEQFVEIGPGLGALTEKLQQFGGLTVIEVEPKFCAELRRKWSDLKIIQEDVREVDLGALGEQLVVFGNLPYSLSTEIVFHLLKFAPRISRAVLLLQREFAERMAAKPGGRAYSTLSIACQMWADLTLGKVVSGDSFHPQTRVESRLVALQFLPQARFKLDDPVWFEKVVRAAFVQRRKKIINSLVASGCFSRTQASQGLAAAGISSDCRAETVDIEAFVKLSAVLRRG